jgi:hypothetical protein
MKRTVLCVAGIAVALVSCKSKPKPMGPDQISLDEARKRAAIAGPILDAIKKIDPTKIPAVTKETKLPAFPSRWVGGEPRDDEDAIGLYPEDLKNPGALNDVPYEVPHHDLARCTKMFEAAKAGKEDRFYKDLLVGCTKVKYAILVRTTSVVKPKFNTTVDTNTAAKTRTEKTAFVKGSVSGELIAIDLATGKVAGAVKFRAENSERPDGIYSGTPEKVLDDDLKKNVLAALHSS